MKKGFFITGTDTDVGKTVTALSLMQALQYKGYRVGGFKPVSAGCKRTADGLINDDAKLLQQDSSLNLPYSIVNPFAFEPPIAPHIAAEQAGVTINLEQIQSCYTQIASQNDLVIVEGAGGWLVPISDEQTMADVARALDLPVILVIGIRLGCLNHGMLTMHSILSSDLACSGWIANHLAPESTTSKENVRYLQQHFDAPLIAQLPFDYTLSSADRTGYFDLDLLL